jgi:serine/threonine protein kinase
MESLFYKDDVDSFHDCEKAIYEKLGHHPNILRFLKESINPDTERLALTFPNHHLGTLEDRIQSQGRNIPLHLRLAWAKEIAGALLHIHSKGVVWLDMTPVNILLTEDDHLVMCDFGGSKMAPHYMGEIMPSPVWLAPIDNEQSNENQDRFSFGIMLFYLITLHFPHNPGKLHLNYYECIALHERHRSFDFDRTLSVFQPRELEDVVMKCWHMKYKSTQDLVNDLQKITSVEAPKSKISFASLFLVLLFACSAIIVAFVFVRTS